MSTTPTVERDERTVAVENASYRWAYLFLSFGLLALVAYRSFMHHESPWDLMTLVVLGGVLSAAYQGFHKVLTARWAATCLLTVVAAGALAALTAWLR
jgi:hypothetical protein